MPSGKAGDTAEANQLMSELAATNAAIQSSLETDLELAGDGDTAAG